MSARFYFSGPIIPGDLTLSGKEAHHLGTVRRFVSGDRITLFNGDGRDYPAEVIGSSAKTVLLYVAAAVIVEREFANPLVIASAIPKGDRGDFLIEKLTELGVGRFIPLFTDRSIVHPKESRLEKWRHAVVEASKQCGRNVLMHIAPMTALTHIVADISLPKLRMIAHTGASESSRSIAEYVHLPNTSDGIAALIGPEGGFTAQEIALATERGWQSITLGSRTLRIETAALAIAAWAGISLSNPSS